MRKILIDNTIDKLAQAYYKELADKNILSAIETSLNQLIKEVQDTNDKKYTRYLEHIRDNLYQIITMHPDKFEELDKHFKTYKCNLKRKRWIPKKSVTFSDRIVDALKYKEIRKSIFPRYVSKLKIQTCVYCNTQYALTVGEEDGGELAAYYELDHAWPKANYPFLAISFYNLQPCCGACNKRKSDKGKPYSIYVEKSPAESTVQFSIKNESLVDYILTHNRDNLKIQVDTEDKELSDLYDKIGVRKRYSKLNDEAEEMIWKAKIYNESYFEQLNKAYGVNYIKSRSNLFRFLYGVYAEEENVYTRPLTKMKQDIAKQLKML